MAQDTALSRLKQGFDSPRGYQTSRALIHTKSTSRNPSCLIKKKLGIHPESIYDNLKHDTPDKPNHAVQ